MRRGEEMPLEPEVSEALEALDATLAGEAVDPRHADLAELALLLRDARPEIPPASAEALDERVRRRFVPSAPAGAHGRRRGRRWLWLPASGVAASLAVAVAIVVSENPRSSQAPVRSPVGAAAPATGTAAAKLPTPAAGHALGPPQRTSSGQAAAASTASGSLAPGLQPPANGRRIIQGAQLALSTAPARVEDVAQEIFDVAGRENAIVQNSTVTATGGPGGYAQIQLSVPSASLAQAMTALSSLPYAHVASRSDTTQDVNDQYQRTARALADARALRTSLLKELAGATTQAQIDSLTARIHDADASISSDEAALRSLGHQIAYSQVMVMVNAGVVPVPLATSSGHGFTLGTAVHDAGRVLTVAAGVALIVLAALVPVALLAALGWWIFWVIRRRRHEHALDLI